MLYFYIITFINVIQTTINIKTQSNLEKELPVMSYPDYLFYASFYDGTVINNTDYTVDLISLKDLTESVNSFSSYFLSRHILNIKTTFATNKQKVLFRSLFIKLKYTIIRNFETLFDIMNNDKTACYLDMCEGFLLESLSSLSSLTSLNSDQNDNIFIAHKKVSIEDKIIDILFSSKFNRIFKVYFKCIKLSLSLMFRNDFVGHIIYTFKKFVRYFLFRRFIDKNNILLNKKELENINNILFKYNKEIKRKTKKIIMGNRWSVFEFSSQPRVRTIKVLIDEVTKISDVEFIKYIEEFENSLYKIKPQIYSLINKENWDESQLELDYIKFYLLSNMKFLIKTYIKRKLEELFLQSDIKLTGEYLYGFLFEKDDRINNRFFVVIEKNKNFIADQIERNKNFEMLRYKLENSLKNKNNRKYKFNKIESIKKIIEDLTKFIVTISI